MTRSGSERGRPLQTIVAAARDRDLAHAALAQREQMKQAERTRADDQHALEGLGLRDFLRMHHARERFEQRGLFEREILGLAKRVLLHDVRRDEQEIRIGAEQHLVHRLRAEIFLSALAIETDSARRGRRGHQRVANFEVVDALADLDHDARKIRDRTASASATSDGRGETLSNRCRN